MKKQKRNKKLKKNNTHKDIPPLWDSKKKMIPMKLELIKNHNYVHESLWKSWKNNDDKLKSFIGEVILDEYGDLGTTPFIRLETFYEIIDIYEGIIGEVS